MTPGGSQKPAVGGKPAKRPPSASEPSASEAKPLPGTTRPRSGAFQEALKRLASHQTAFLAGHAGPSAHQALRDLAELYLYRLRQGALNDVRLSFSAEAIARENDLLLPIVEDDLRRQLSERNPFDPMEGLDSVPIPPLVVLDEAPGPAAYGCAEELLAYFAPNGLRVGDWGEEEFDRAHDAFVDFLAQSLDRLPRAPALNDLIEQMAVPYFPAHSADGYVSAHRSLMTSRFIPADRYASEFLVAVLNEDWSEYRALIDTDDGCLHLRAEPGVNTTLCGEKVRLGLRTRWKSASKGDAIIAARSERGPWEIQEICHTCRADERGAAILAEDGVWVLPAETRERMLTENKAELIDFLSEARDGFVDVAEFEAEFGERTLRRALDLMGELARERLAGMRPAHATRALLGSEYCDYVDSVAAKRQRLPGLPGNLVGAALERYHDRATAREPSRVLPGPKREMNDVVFAWLSERMDIPEPEETKRRRRWGDQAMRLAYRALYGEALDADAGQERPRDLVILEAALFQALEDAYELEIEQSESELVVQAAREVWGAGRSEWPGPVRRFLADMAGRQDESDG